MTSLPQHMQAWGWRGVSVFAFLLAAGAFWFALVGTRLDAPLAREVTGTGDRIMVAPATGVEGYDAALFCADPKTKVLPFPAPDATGTTYQLTRIKDGKTETVTVVIGADKGILFATHYFDTAVGQGSEPAIVSAEARKCIEKPR